MSAGCLTYFPLFPDKITFKPSDTIANRSKDFSFLRNQRTTMTNNLIGQRKARRTDLLESLKGLKTYNTTDASSSVAEHLWLYANLHSPVGLLTVVRNDAGLFSADYKFVLIRCFVLCQEYFIFVFPTDQTIGDSVFIEIKDHSSITVWNEVRALR